jgi:hypothetical protein
LVEDPQLTKMEVIAIELQQLINQLEAILDDGKRVPFSDRLAIDEESCRQIIDQMRVSLPDVIRQAQRTMGERDRIIAQANEEAGRIVQMAREQAVDLVENHELVEQANARSEQIIAEAEQEVATMRAEADQYAVNSLAQLAEQVARLQREVDNGIQALQEQLKT